MAQFTSDDVVKHLQALKLQYIQENIGNDPGQLPHHFAEFLGYATLLYDHYANTLRGYRQLEAKVIKEENDNRDTINKIATGRDDRMSIAELEQRVQVRLSGVRSTRDYLEVAVKGATLHINGCQSLMKNWGDEAKGIR